MNDTIAILIVIAVCYGLGALVTRIVRTISKRITAKKKEKRAYASAANVAQSETDLSAIHEFSGDDEL